MLSIKKLAGIINEGNQVVIPAAATSKYRFQQTLLFQRAHVKSIPFVYTNSSDQQIAVPGVTFNLDGSSYTTYCYGPNKTFICPTSKWPWANQNVGDWVDANGVQQGSTPFVSSSLIANGTAANILSLDATSLMNYVNTKKQWCTFLIKIIGGGTFPLIGSLNTLGAPQSTLTIQYADSTTETLQVWVTSALVTSTSRTVALDDVISVSSSANGVIEFFRPSDQTKTISSATINLSHNTVAGGSLTVQLFVVSPLLPNLTPVSGIAANYTLDQGIEAHPSVIVAQEYTASKILTDVLDVTKSGDNANPFVPGAQPALNRAEHSFDPTLWGTPGVDHLSDVAMPTENELNNLLPRREFGKLVGNTKPDRIRVVDENDSLAASRGFTPLASGRTALEVVLKGSGIKHGQCWYDSAYSGGSDLDLWFDRARIGQATDVSVRYYVMLGSGWDANSADFGLYFTAPFQHVGKYPDEVGLNPNTLPVRQGDRSGKFFGGVQQQTAGTVWKHYNYPTRQRLDGTPDDTTTNYITGGGYGVTSGAVGFQGRYLFSQGAPWEFLPGPAVGGAALGVELYDFGSNLTAIPSQTHIGSWDSNYESYASKNGGIGFLKPFNWYCFEMRWKLNSIVPYTLPPRGTDYREGGFLVDGQIQFYVDGILANQTPLFATRSSLMLDWALQVSSGQPFDKTPGSPTNLRAITNISDSNNYMGFASFIGAPYYGGRSPAARDMCSYFDGIVVATEYIGPMQGLPREKGGLS